MTKFLIVGTIVVPDVERRAKHLYRTFCLHAHTNTCTTEHNLLSRSVGAKKRPGPSLPKLMAQFNTAVDSGIIRITV